MKNVITVNPENDIMPISKRQLRVAAYCRISTEHDEQANSLELQEEYFQSLLDGNCQALMDGYRISAQPVKINEQTIIMVDQRRKYHVFG